MQFRYSKRKTAILFANSGDPDWMPHSAASDLGLPMPFWGGGGGAGGGGGGAGGSIIKRNSYIQLYLCI